MTQKRLSDTTAERNHLKAALEEATQLHQKEVRQFEQVVLELQSKLYSLILLSLFYGRSFRLHHSTRNIPLARSSHHPYCTC